MGKFKLVVLIGIVFMLISGCQKAETEKVKENSTTLVTIWHYYNGVQQTSFDNLIAKFNESEGKEKGIVVEAYSQGGIPELEESVLNATNKKVGADKLPNIFAAYPDTAFQLDEMGILADIGEYFTEEEMKEYIEGYIEEGKLFDGSLKIFPVAKATENMVINETDWNNFAAETGAELSQLNTIEGLTKVAEQYYEWSGGKAFFGRDAMANYFIIGMKQLGQDIIDKEDHVVLNFSEEIVRKLWDNYYVPYIKGHFLANGRFRSDDMRTGDVIAYVGSSASGIYTPERVIVSDSDSYPITTKVMMPPKFEEGENYAVSQGAGMVVTQGEQEEIEASVAFLKWFTRAENNIEFTIATSYLPVTYQGNDLDLVHGYIKEQGIPKQVEDAIISGIETVDANQLYSTKACANGGLIRKSLEYGLSDKAANDRKEILAKIEQGISYEDAVGEFNTEENFKAWYGETKQALENIDKE